MRNKRRIRKVTVTYFVESFTSSAQDTCDTCLDKIVVASDDPKEAQRLLLPEATLFRTYFTVCVSFDISGIQEELTRRSSDDSDYAESHFGVSSWYVPGGKILKDKDLSASQKRLKKNEGYRFIRAKAGVILCFAECESAVVL